MFFELPGPSLYAFHALLSFEPPEKNDLEKGILFEFPYGMAMPEKKWKALRYTAYYWAGFEVLSEAYNKFQEWSHNPFH